MLSALLTLDRPPTFTAIDTMGDNKARRSKRFRPAGPGTAALHHLIARPENASKRVRPSPLLSASRAPMLLPLPRAYDERREQGSGGPTSMSSAAPDFEPLRRGDGNAERSHGGSGGSGRDQRGGPRAYDKREEPPPPAVRYRLSRTPQFTIFTETADASSGGTTRHYVFLQKTGEDKQLMLEAFADAESATNAKEAIRVAAVTSSTGDVSFNVATLDNEHFRALYCVLIDHPEKKISVLDLFRFRFGSDRTQRESMDEVCSYNYITSRNLLLLLLLLFSPGALTVIFRV
jgi:hypothetical protein